MRGIQQFAAAAFRPRNLFLAALLVGSLWAAAGGLLPTGPKPSGAVEARPVVELTGPQANDRNVARIVTLLMRREHLSKHPLDDEISRRSLDNFIKSLDSMKLYFYRSDIDEFSQKRNEIDDMVNQGDVTFAYTVFSRLLKRIDERVALVDELLKQPLDFNTDDVFITDPDKLSFPSTPEEARERWIKRLKYDLLLLKSDKEANKEDPKVRLSRRYHSYAKRMHQTDSNELLELFLSAVTTSFDPHSNYMAPASSENFGIIMGLQLEGIGAQLKLVDGQTVIDKVIPGGAAAKSGELKAGDRIVSVGQGDEGEIVDVGEMRLNDVVKLIRGRAGSVVRLGVIPAEGTGLKVIKITRAKVELKDSEARGVIFEEGRKADGTPFKVGVIDLPSFYMDMSGAREGTENFKSCSRDVRRILEDFNKKGVDSLILDLRRNGGGSLTEAINLTGMFIEDGPVLQVKDPDGRVQEYDDTDRGAMLWKGPLVVLTSKFSASASEILAAAIQDYHRGLVIGDSATHGKGTVQTMVDLGPQMFRIANPPDLGSLKLTVQQFYRPNGDSTQQRGVLADITLPSLTDHMDVSESDLDYPVAFDKVPAAPFKRYDDVTANVVSTLKEKSSQRIAQSEEFKKLNRDIERYVEQKAKKEVPLNEAKFLARRAELDAEAEDEKTFEHQANGDEKEVVKRDYYFNEALNITLDYLRLLGKDKVAKAN
ncbi:MAG: carboxy terminal-processing peptidase [Pirellulaceae bacterium]|nr:carboxy terminal-processing peptidase [Pirellulaceae bacterium]